MTACAHCPELRRLRRVVLHQQRVIEAVRATVARRRLPVVARQTLQDATGRPNGLAERVRARGDAERAEALTQGGISGADAPGAAQGGQA